jgi:hypothetical protein
MARLHVNAKRLRPAIQTELLYLCLRNTAHQLEAWDLSDDELAPKLLLCDLIVQGPDTRPRLIEHEGDVTMRDSAPLVGLELAWLSTNGRLLGGNHGHLTLGALEASTAFSHLVAKAER